jgi:tRNA(Ile)-lysidine synthase
LAKSKFWCRSLFANLQRSLVTMPASLKAEFDAAMARSGPFAAKPQLTVGVSGGADSTALALLAQNWVAERGGNLLALIVDHGLRQGSDLEAALTSQRLEARGITTQVLTLTGLNSTKLQETARRTRHAALSAATRKAGALFLLLGHHAADQSETVAMRAERGNSGLEGMASWTARNDAVLLRPLLTIAPAHLRAFLREENMPWAEDPSNQDRRFERVRVRLAGITAVPKNPSERQESEIQLAVFLARHTIIRPEGFAVILADSAPAAALASLLRTIGGSQYSPRQNAVAKLADRLRPATLGGVRVLKTVKFGQGWLLARESASCAAPIPAKRNSLWDDRFRLLDDTEGGICGAVGAETPIFRNASNLPAAILRGLPCVRMPGTRAKPWLAKAFFTPPIPAAGLPFVVPESRSFFT